MYAVLSVTAGIGVDYWQGSDVLVSDFPRRFKGAVAFLLGFGPRRFRAGDKSRMPISYRLSPALIAVYRLFTGKEFMMRESRRAGFSLVELLVVIAVIGLLIALLLPAVQAARETARKTQCKNNLKQIGLAFQSHVSVFQRFPTNGWGHLWIGVPDRGTGPDQPGGWIYNVLPYLEQSGLRERGKELAEAEQRRELGRLTQIPLAVLRCPTRPAPLLSPADSSRIPRNASWTDNLAKSDYAANGGDFFIRASVWEGPETLADGDAGRYTWADRGKLTGVCFQRSEIRPAGVLDGLSNTYLVGEKHVSRDNYNAAGDEGYNESMYHGSSFDITRWVLAPPGIDDREVDYFRFGSAHTGGCHFVFCDGSVRLIHYEIDVEVHRRMGNRRDGDTVPGTRAD